MTACPDCGLDIRPSNLERHRKARHLPKPRLTAYGTRYTPPAKPIRLGRRHDRRYDEIVPRGRGAHRYRIYRLRAGELELLHSTSTPQRVGVALVALHSDGEFVGDDSVGILDTATEPGHWIVSPWTLGRIKTEEEVNV